MRVVEVKRGQRWIVSGRLDVAGITMWKAPFTGGFHCTIPIGTVVVVERDPVPQATAVYCLPNELDGMELALVPEEDRVAEKYNGYALVIPLDEFGRTLEPADPESLP